MWPSRAAATPRGRGLTPRATRLARLLRIGLHIARGVGIAAFAFPFVGGERRSKYVQRWSQKVLAILAVHLQVGEDRPSTAEAPFMIVANHVSWLDIIAISAVLPARFVAKSEVREWPVIGWMSEKAGTLFIRRGRRRDILRVNEELAQTLRGGDPVAVFPESTTTDGSTLLKFHPSLLQPAVLAGAPVRPVALRYVRPDGTRCTEAVFVDGRSLWESLNLMVTQPQTVAEVAFLAPIGSAGRHRRDLATGAREAILRSLFPPARDSRS